MPTVNNFNCIVWLYDWLKHLVFGDKLNKAESTYLSVIISNQRILICGGGTGRILETLDNLDIPCEIDYIEKSEQMLNRTRRRAPFSNLSVNYIYADVMDTQLAQYDVIITSFFLDVLTKTQLEKVIYKLSGHHRQSKIWLLTDFVPNGKKTNKWLLNLMYLFFKITTRIDANAIEDYVSLISQHGYVVQSKRLFVGHQVAAVLFSGSKN